MNATLTEEITNLAKVWRDAPHCRKGQILSDACQRLQITRTTLYRRLKQCAVTPPRKRRSDAGQVALPRDEALMISAVLREHMRKNGKQIKSVADAVAVLRANGLIAATRIDRSTGEVVELSDSAIFNALRSYRLHPDQLAAPAPVTPLRSLHPNHVWQIDASRCVLYYLPQSGKDNGLRIADETEFYKNKPANLIKQIRESLWRYAITDHRSGWVYADYVTGGETGQNISDVFIRAMCRRDGESMHGVPTMVMLDPGSANTGAIFNNLCRALHVRVQVDKPRNPRAKGQVENAQNLIERSFESTLRLLPIDQVASLEQINGLAARWRIYFNGARKHGRHGQTRDAAWLHITEEQLIIPPGAQILRELAVTEHESRVVSPLLHVSYRGATYDVSAVPNVIVGERLMVTRNPWREDSIQALGVDADGGAVYHVASMVQFDEFGQIADAPIIGQAYARHADTPVQTNLKELELLATGTQTEEEAAAVRKARGVLFEGRIDPFKHIDDAQVPVAMPRRGTVHELEAPAVQLPPLTHIQAAKALRARIDSWSKKHYEWLVANYPDGVPAEGLDAVEAALRAGTAPQVRSLIKVA